MQEMVQLKCSGKKKKKSEFSSLPISWGKKKRLSEETQICKNKKTSQDDLKYVQITHLLPAPQNPTNISLALQSILV